MGCRSCGRSNTLWVVTHSDGSTATFRRVTDARKALRDGSELSLTRLVTPPQ